MKRLISLVLAIAMLLSLAPAVFAEGEAKAELAFGMVQTNKATKNDGTEFSYYTVPVIAKYKTSDSKLSLFQCYIDYDKNGLKPVGTISLQDGTKLKSVVYNSSMDTDYWTTSANPKDGQVPVVATMTPDDDYDPSLAITGGEVTLFSLNFMCVDQVENGSYSLKFAEPQSDGSNVFENVIGLKLETEADYDYRKSTDTLTYTDTATITVTDGVDPTLDSVSISPTDYATYGTRKEYNLTATSTSGRDITGLVEWTVPSGITYNEDKLTVSTEENTDAGTYKIKGKCGDAEKETTLTVNPATISNVDLTLSDYAKGNKIADATVTSATGTSTSLRWFEADDTEATYECFKANTAYKVEVQITITDENHIWADNATATLGNDVQNITAVSIVDYPTKYIATFELTPTANKDTPTIHAPSDGLSAVYGQTLNSVSLTGFRATFGNDEAEVTGDFAWQDSTELVGSVGSQQHTIVFTPSDTETYATTTAQVTVNVTAVDISGATIADIENQEYTGSEVTPEPEVKLGEVVLTKDVDYTLSYENHTNIGENAKVKVTGKGNYTGTCSKTFKITKSISACDITLRPADDTGYSYTGNEIKPTVTVKDGNNTLTEGTDYTVTYGKNINAGENAGLVTITGAGNYTGSVEEHFTIEPQVLNITTNTITIPGTYTYDGTAKEPDVSTLTVGRTKLVTLTLGTDYTVEYSDNVNAGTEAKITFKPKTGSNYTFDQFTLNFTIGKATLTDIVETKSMSIRYGVTAAQTFSDWGLPVGVEFTATLGTTTDNNNIISGTPTISGTTLTFTPNETTSTNVGNTATIPVTFSSTNYNDFTITLTVTISNKLSAGLEVTSLTDGMSMTYGDEKTVTWSVAEAAKGEDGEIAFTSSANDVIAVENNKLRAAKVGTATITVTYDSADYYDQKTFTITVNKKPITITAENKTIAYGDNPLGFSYTYPNGAMVGNDRPNIKPSTDATATSPVGTYPITLTEGEDGNPNYDVTLVPGTLTITKAPLKIESVTVKGKEYDGDKTATVSEVKLSGMKNNETLEPGTDYTVSGEFKDANAGEEKEVTVTVTLSTTGTAANYELKSSTITTTAKIEKNKPRVTYFEAKNAVYTGQPYDVQANTKYTTTSHSTPTYTFYADKDGQVDLNSVIERPTNVGKYYVAVTFAASQNESDCVACVSFNITAKSLADSDIIVDAIPNQTYTGLPITPAVTVQYNGMTLKAGTDYAVVPSGNCTDAGQATVHINGNGNYSGIVAQTFQIVPKPVEGVMVTFSNETLTYNGQEQHPAAITVGSGATGIPAENYTVAYSNNTNAGTATATVTFTGNYSGTATGTFTIAPKTIETLTWSDDTFYYDKTEKTVTATANGLIDGDTATVTVTGGKQTAIGSYIATATAISNPNYKLADGLIHKFEIKNAIESISVVSPKTVSATVDGLTIKLVGTMSEGEQLTLKINGSEHVSVSTFVKVEGIEYTLDKSDLKTTPNDVTLAEKPADVPDAPENASDDLKQAVDAVKSEGGASSSGLAAAAAAAVTNEAAKKDTSESEKEVKADVKLEIEVTDYQKSTEGKSILTLEITPKVTYTYKDESGKQKTETETISNSDIKAPVTISVKLPEGMSLTDIFVKHGEEYIKPTVNKETRVITWEQSSFSPSVIMSYPGTANIKLVKEDGTTLDLTLDAAWINKTLPADEGKTNFKGWDFGDGIGTISTITGDILAKLVEKANNGTLTATSVSGSSSNPDDKPSKPSKPGSSSSGPLLPSLGDDELIFRDVSKYDYYYNAVKWAVKKGVTSGTGRYTFSPDDACTRAQTVTFLWRAAGCPKASTKTNPFTDVHTSDYFYEAVLWAVENGITNGTSSTTFSPNASVTRAQVATFLWRANGEPAAKDSGFTDVSANAYYAKAVAWAYAEGITTGTGFGVFSPDNVCTRAQIVTFLFRNAK